MRTMTPLALWPAAARARIHGVLTDIDDTLTTEGAITPDALDALHRLRAAGLPVFAITGRPAGWSEGFALEWPVDAIVAENGAVALWRGANGDLCRDHLQDSATRAANFYVTSCAKLRGLMAEEAVMSHSLYHKPCNTFRGGRPWNPRGCSPS